jgi:uncharacterized tellurite resistance protein B-like protein
MIKVIKNLFCNEQINRDKVKQNDKQLNTQVKKLQIATCILFVEMASIDNNFEEDERNFIISLMEKKFDIEKQYIDELIELGESKVSESDSIYEYTTIINQQFSMEDKFELLKNLWQLIFINKKLDTFEEQLVKKIDALLDMNYRDVIAAKLLVKNEMKN